MKKIIITSILTVSLFFCFFTKVKADTITTNMTSAQFDLLDNLPTMLETISNSNYSTHKYVILGYRRYSSDPWEYIFAHVSSGDRPYLNWVSSWSKLGIWLPDSKNCFSSDFTSIGSCTYFTQNIPNWTGAVDLLNPDSIYRLIYISPDTYLISSSDPDPNTYYFTYDDKTFEFNANTMPMPTIYSLNEYFNAPPPTPPDDTPLLTSFVNVVLDKLTLTTDFFTSSYIYLSIFVIFIFYFSICLLRRFTK